MGYCSTIEFTDFSVNSKDVLSFYKHLFKGLNNKSTECKNTVSFKTSKEQFKEYFDNLASWYGMEFLWSPSSEAKTLVTITLQNGEQFFEDIENPDNIIGFQGNDGKHYYHEEFLKVCHTFNNVPIVCEELGEDGERWAWFCQNGKVENVKAQITYLSPFTGEVWKP